MHNIFPRLGSVGSTSNNWYRSGGRPRGLWSLQQTKPEDDGRWGRYRGRDTSSPTHPASSHVANNTGRTSSVHSNRPTNGHHGRFSGDDPSLDKCLVIWKDSLPNWGPYVTNQSPLFLYPKSERALPWTVDKDISIYPTSHRILKRP